MLKDLDYQTLKKSLGFLVDRFVPTEFLNPEAHPLRVLERFEKKRVAMARRGLIVAIADMTRGLKIFRGHKFAKPMPGSKRLARTRLHSCDRN